VIGRREVALQKSGPLQRSGTTAVHPGPESGPLGADGPNAVPAPPEKTVELLQTDGVALVGREATAQAHDRHRLRRRRRRGRRGGRAFPLKLAFAQFFDESLGATQGVLQPLFLVGLALSVRLALNLLLALNVRLALNLGLTLAVGSFSALSCATH
jgi:hypothetical protein